MVLELYKIFNFENLKRLRKFASCYVFEWQLCPFSQVSVSFCLSQTTRCIVFFFFLSSLVKIIFDSLSYSWVLIKHTVFLESINYRIQWQFQINYTSFFGQEQRQSEKHYGKHFNIVTWPSGTIDTSVI